MSVLVPVGQLLDQVVDKRLSLLRDQIICSEVTVSGRSNSEVPCEKQPTSERYLNSLFYNKP